MKKLFLALLVFGLVSCEQIEKLDAQMEPDSTDVANEIADVKKEMAIVEQLAKEGESKLLFKAFGTEPGWYMEIYSGHMKVLLNYGKDSLWISDDFYKAADSGGFDYEAENDGGKITLKIKDEKCTDDAKGDTHNRKVELKVQNKTYTGWGDTQH